MEKNKIDLSKFLVNDGLSLQEERDTSLAVSEYLIKKKSIQPEQLDHQVKVVLEIDFSKEFLENHTDFRLDLAKIDVFNLLSIEKTELIHPKIPFPKTKNLDDIFNFLVSLTTLSNKASTHISFKHVKDSDRVLIDSLLYFKYLSLTDDDYLITESFTKLYGKSIENKYILFIKQLGKSPSVRDILRLQLSSEHFDSINKNIIRNDLLGDGSIIEENLTDRELKSIINNMRSWHLSIKRKLREPIL